MQTQLLSHSLFELLSIDCNCCFLGVRVDRLRWLLSRRGRGHGRRRLGAIHLIAVLYDALLDWRDVYHLGTRLDAAGSCGTTFII